MTARRFIALGAILGATGVAAGAFGAHTLAEILTPEWLKVFETATRYHLIHAVALVTVGVVASNWPSSLVNAAGYLLLSGVILFSGSLYALVLSNMTWWGMVTPFGGAALIAGWCALAWAVWDRK